MLERRLYLQQDRPESVVPYVAELLDKANIRVSANMLLKVRPKPLVVEVRDIERYELEAEQFGSSLLLGLGVQWGSRFKHVRSRK